MAPGGLVTITSDGINQLLIVVAFGVGIIVVVDGMMVVVLVEGKNVDRV
jgi:hypothetical protein